MKKDSTSYIRARAIAPGTPALPSREKKQPAAEIRKAVRARYAPQLMEAGFFRRRILESQIEVEILREIGKIDSDPSN